MTFLVSLASLCALMYVAYRGMSVILFAPICALGAVLLTQPSAVLPAYSGIFQENMVVFVRLYFPAFLLGAIFGKVIEMSGFARTIVSSVVNIVGRERAILAIVIVGALLTYGGVSLFVVVFAVYPFAAEMFRQLDIPKRLIPATIALGAFTFTMDALPGTPQIQNIIPTVFFKTNGMAAPVLGTIGAVLLFICGMAYLEWRLHVAVKAGEGYGTGHINEPDAPSVERTVHPLIAIAPLFVVGIANLIFTKWIPTFYDKTVTLKMNEIAKPVTQEVARLVGIWAVEVALVCGVLFVVIFGWKQIRGKFGEGSKQAIAGSLLATINTASEYGFGAVASSLPGFIIIRDAISSIPNPLVNEALTVTTLAGITGSASGGMSIALAAMADTFIQHAHAAGIPLEVFHRVASMASGGMDTLPHNGAVITLLAVTGLTHIQSYKDIFAITVMKTTMALVIIGIYYLTGWV